MIGIRELRADLAAHVRRAGAGEPTVITVDGRPSAVLGPLSLRTQGNDITIAALVASGGLLPPRRTDGTLPSRIVSVWGNVRLDRLLREIRG
jgi:prevent-host-death family protein